MAVAKTRPGRTERAPFPHGGQSDPRFADPKPQQFPPAALSDLWTLRRAAARTTRALEIAAVRAAPGGAIAFWPRRERQQRPEFRAPQSRRGLLKTGTELPCDLTFLI